MKNISKLFTASVNKLTIVFCQISDFGLSKWKEFTMTHTSAAVLGGTPTHIPPEKWSNYEMEPDVTLDVYSFGIMLWELYAYKKPFASCRSGNLAFCDCTFLGRLCEKAERVLGLLVHGQSASCHLG